MILYFKNSGLAYLRVQDSGNIDKIVNLDALLENKSEEFKKSINVYYGNMSNNWWEYDYNCSPPRELSDIEIEECLKYGKILTNEERYENKMLNKLIPSNEEIQKAENTIEILELLSEVL